MKLHLLENRNIGSYATFGSYWDKGETSRETFRLTNEAGEAIPVQTEIAARWADGSVKWARHTADARRMGSRIEVLPGEAAIPDRSVCVEETQEGWRIDAGRVTLTVCRAGTDCLAADVCLDGRQRVSRIAPVFLLERRTQHPDGEDILPEAIDAAALRRAVVMAEVLGKPRALRKY